MSSSPSSFALFGPPNPRSPFLGPEAGVAGESGGGSLFVDGKTSADDVGIRILKLNPVEGNYCGGQVGKGGHKMCVRPQGECTTQSHTRIKAVINVLGGTPHGSVDGVFTDTKSPQVVYTTDVLPLDKLTRPFDQLAQDTRPPSQWGQYFRTVAGCPTGGEVAALENMADVHEEMLGSPYKKQRVIDVEQGGLERSEHPAAERSSVALKLAHLATLIGKQGEGSSTESILAQLARLENIIEKGCLTEDQTNAIDSIFENYGNDLAGLRQAAVTLAVKKLEEDLDPMLKWFWKWTDKKPDGSIGAIGGALDDQLERLERKIQRPTLASSPSTPRLSHPHTPLFERIQPTPRPSLAQPAVVTALENQVRLLKEKVDTLQEQVAGDSVSIGGVIFRSKTELKSWIQRNVFDANMQLCFADPCAIFNMASTLGADNETVLNFHSAARKAGFGEGYLTLAQLSFNFVLPLNFIQKPGGKSTNTVIKDCRVLPRAKSADDWDTGSLYGGVKKDMLAEVEGVRQMLESTLSSTDQLTPEGHRVATVCLSQSIVFINNLFTWMSTTYFGGKQDGQAEQPLWNYISHSVREISRNLHVARRSGQRPNPEPADCMWGFFQGLKLANEFNAADFSGHQVLSHVLNLHLHDRAVMKETLETKLKAMQKSLDKAVDEVKQCQKPYSKRLEEVAALAKAAQAARVAPGANPTCKLPGFTNPIGGLVSHKLLPSNVKVGILASGHPTALWYLGMMGKPLWIASGHELPARREGDPPRFKREVCPTDLPRVDVLVVQGKWPKKTSAWWTGTGASLILRVSRKDERGGHRFPELWEIRTDLVHHCETGGVTNGIFKRWWAVPKETPLFKVTPFQGPLRNTLSQILKPTEKSTLTGRRWCEIPEKGELNTGRGLMDWNSRFRVVKSPSVFRKDQWTVRHLAPTEKESILDFPENRCAGLPLVTRDALLKEEIPGKIWVAGLSIIDTWSGDIATGRGQKRLADDPSRLPDRQPLVKKVHPGEVNLTEAVHNPNVGCEEKIGWTQETGAEMVPMHLLLKSESEEGVAGEPNSTVTDKATKADGAAVPVHLWNNRVAALLQKSWQDKGVNNPPINFASPEDRVKFHRILDNVRSRLLAIWKSRVRRSFQAWFKALPSNTEHKAEIKRDGIKACLKAREASWWAWDKGSAIFFWRWPDHYQEIARRGVAPFFDTDPPANRDEQPPYSDESVRLMVKKKLANVLEKDYIELCDIEDIEAMMYMFHVPKGADDIRMVYDGSKSGLNKALWAPWFALPNVDTMARWVVAGSWLVDNDYGEQFLNFPLHPDLQRFCGVDLTQLFPEWKDPQLRLVVGRWTRNAMGLKPSPYNSVQGALIAKHAITGKPEDTENPFSWKNLKLNLPGSATYDATLPWLMKIRHDGLLASGLVQYIDDLRGMASTRELAWACSSRIAKELSFLGLQDAARKRRECTQNPGAWAGAVISTDKGLFKSVTSERWEKTQAKVRHLGHAVGAYDEFSNVDKDAAVRTEITKGSETGPAWVRFKPLESITGFLVYVSMTYTMMVPYIKGLHLTLNSWRPNRDDEGWKSKRDVLAAFHGPPPEFVRAVPRFQGDVEALMALTKAISPPKIPVRALANRPLLVVGDASGSGFGVSAWRQGSREIHVSHGNWSEQVTREASSNFREAANLALGLRRLFDLGHLPPGSEVWVFTDNSCAEKTFYKGASSSPLLHELVLGLRKLEIEGSLILHFVWIPGTRMIAQGTDGLSRGDFTSGVMAGENFLKYIPLNKSALEREKELEDIIKSWVPGNWKVASPEAWFHQTRLESQIGWIWAPPPCLARTALDELCETKHMFPYSSHIFVCPALMTGTWRKDLGKLADVVFTIKAGSTIWGTLGPSAGCQAWIDGKVSCLICSKEIDRLSGVICGNYGVRSHHGKICKGAWHGACFRQADQDRFPILDMQDLDDALVNAADCGDGDTLRFREARDGDHLMTPFQCVDCHFVNLKGRFPEPNNHKDALAVTAITRAILDSLWSRERTTVESNRCEGIRYLSHLELMGLQEDAYPARGPFPKRDIWGMRVACALLSRSMSKGKNARRVQFETVRKLRAHHSNMVHSCPEGASHPELHVVDRGHESILSNAPTNSLWFRRFMIGCHRRMGDVWLPDRPLTAPILRQALSLLAMRWPTQGNDVVGKLKTGMTACMLLAGYYGALRGEEIVRVDAGLMRKHWAEAIRHEQPHIPLLLTGRFKQVDGPKVFCQPLARVTQAGMDIEVWFRRVLDLYVDAGVSEGPFFRISSGKRAGVADLDVWFRSILKAVQSRCPHLINDDADLGRFSMRRSARRGATSEAQNSGIPDDIIEANNRWRKKFRSKGLNPRMSMLERYTDAEANVPSLVRFSYLLRH